MTTIHAGDRTTGCDECATNDYKQDIWAAGYDADAVAIYADYIYGKNLAEWEDWISEFEDCYVGPFNSDEDFAIDWIDGTGMLADLPAVIQTYFDYDKFARDLMMDFWEHDGHYFRSY